jgi:hypothetical protein
MEKKEEKQKDNRFTYSSDEGLKVMSEKDILDSIGKESDKKEVKKSESTEKIKMNDQVEIINNLGQKEMVSKKFAETLERIRKRTESMPVKKDSNGLPCYEEIPIWDFPEDEQEEMRSIGRGYKDTEDNTEKSVEMTNSLGKKFIVTEAFAKSYHDTMEECKATCKLLGIDFDEIQKSARAEKIKGGMSDNKSLKEIAQKHDVDIDDILKQLEL